MNSKAKILFSTWLLLGLAACTTPATPITSPTQASAPTPVPQITTAPVSAGKPIANAWADLNLTGRIIFSQSQGGIWELNLEASTLRTVFAPEDPSNSWVNAVSVAPDGQMLVAAYAPPPPPGQIQFGYSDLYLMPVDGSAPPQPFLERPKPKESYFNPVWSPNGQYIYYAHLMLVPVPQTDPPQNTFQYNIERIAYSNGTPELIVQDAFWPRLSNDGQLLTYVSVDPITFENALWVANADGSNKRRLIDSTVFPAVDAPLFTPDGQNIIFGAVSTGVSPKLSWIDWLTGVQIASAHNVPSDWWIVPVPGGEAKRLTEIFDIALFGDFAPDGQHMAFYSNNNGLAVINPDGSGLRQLLPQGGFGTVEWIP